MSTGSARFKRAAGEERDKGSETDSRDFGRANDAFALLVEFAVALR